ncbi:class I SAM-dependent methyltransferase [Pigmentiphaga soli]|uniref:Class I SAM-dependent methyltransferase n=1 Tax=Pigmentiphaga soli TaxID=1007095 RepID=A0ABP8GWD2_9BURK
MHAQLRFSSPRINPPAAGRQPRARRRAVPLFAPLIALSLALPAIVQGQSQGAQATSQAPAAGYTPEVGQAGKDVVWVPTPQALVDRMLDMAQVTPQDYLIDLGSGDGRTVITAAKRGLRAHGIEYNPDMVELARRNAAQAGVADRATFVRADLFESDFSQAQVITMFLLPTINERLRPRLLELKPGTRVVSNSFTMGDWSPDRSSKVEGDCQTWCTALMWIVPARVQGAWRLGSQELRLTQQYQMLNGTLGSARIADGKLEGSRITFTVNGTRYSGTVDGDRMTGKATGGQGGDWTARRV